MIPDSVVMGAGWLFIWSLGSGLIIAWIAIAWDKVANRIDRMWIRGESSSRLETIAIYILNELERRGDK